MQDIKPGGNKQPSKPDGRPKEPLPSPKELYKKDESGEKKPMTAKPQKPRFTGSKVPVSSVHVPRNMPHKQSVLPKSPQTLPSTQKPAQSKKKISTLLPGKISQQLRPFHTPGDTQAVKHSQEARRPHVTHEVAHTSPVPRQKKPPTKLGSRERKLLSVLLGLVVLGLGLAAYILLPSATVTLVVRTAPLLLDQPLTFRNVKSAEPGVVPARTFEREVQVSGATPVASREVIGTKATGSAVIINDTVDEQQIKEQSRLVTDDGVLFYMQRHAIIPSKGAVTVPIEAADPGDQANIEPQELNFAALDESSQSLVYAEVREPITNGSGEEVAVVHEEDLTQAREASVAAARSEVEQEIRAELESGWMLLEESWAGELAELETDGDIDSRQDSISYNGRVTIRVFAFNGQTFEDNLQAALESRLDENYMLFPGPISFTKTVKQVDWDKEEADIEVRVTHTTIPEFSINTLQEKLAGRSKAEAENYLAGLPGIESASINISPFWAFSVPQLEKRIVIDIQPDRNP